LLLYFILHVLVGSTSEILIDGILKLIFFWFVSCSWSNSQRFMVSRCVGCGDLHYSLGGDTANCWVRFTCFETSRREMV